MNLEVARQALRIQPIPSVFSEHLWTLRLESEQLCFLKNYYRDRPILKIVYIGRYPFCGCPDCIMYYALNHTHTQSWIYALWVCLCIYTFYHNESDFPHSEQKMVPTVMNTWEVFLCLTYFKAMKSCLLSLLVSELRQLIVLLPSLLLNILYFGSFNIFVCSSMCMCTYVCVVHVCMKLRGQPQVPFLCTWSLLGFFCLVLFSTGFLTGLKFSSLAVLAGQWASASFLSLSPHFADCKHASSSLAFYVHSGDRTQVFMLA